MDNQELENKAVTNKRVKGKILESKETATKDTTAKEIVIIEYIKSVCGIEIGFKQRIDLASANTAVAKGYAKIVE